MKKDGLHEMDPSERRTRSAPSEEGGNIPPVTYAYEVFSLEVSPGYALANQKPTVIIGLSIPSGDYQ